MTTIVLFREADQTTPFLDWFSGLPERSQLQCRARLRSLAESGHLLRRPAADFLRDGIYELRAKAGGINYRMLYFFHGREAVVISHGFSKQRAAVPQIEIERALRRKWAFNGSPARHTHVMRVSE